MANPPRMPRSLSYFGDSPLVKRARRSKGSLFVHPILIQLGNFPIHTFGMLMGSGFLVGILYSLRQSRKWGLDADGIFNLCFWIMVSGVLGARALYIFIDIALKGHDSEFYSYNVLKLF